MNCMAEIKERLCEELEEMAEMEEWSTGNLQTIHLLTDTIKNLDKIATLEGDTRETRKTRTSGVERALTAMLEETTGKTREVLTRAIEDLRK